MKEEVTLRLYADANTCVGCDHLRYTVDPSVKGWNHDRGDTLAVQDAGGGHLYAVIDHVKDEVHEDRAGRYKFAVAWTQD
jgi:hypothetical protein